DWTGLDKKGQQIIKKASKRAIQHPQASRRANKKKKGRTARRPEGQKKDSQQANRQNCKGERKTDRRPASQQAELQDRKNNKTATIARTKNRPLQQHHSYLPNHQ